MKCGKKTQYPALALLLLLAPWGQSALGENACRTEGAGRLSSLWAQRLVGADFARSAAPGGSPAAVAILASALHPERLAPEARWQGAELDGPQDSTDRRGGDKLANLIFSPVVGAGVSARLTAAIAMGQRTSARELLEAAERLRTLRPKIVAVIPDLGENEAVLSAFQRLSAEGMIFVLPAGDGFPRPIRDNAVALNAIRVGSSSELGIMDLSSQEDPMVDIAAPVGSTLQSAVYSEGKAVLEGMSGTAAAVGLVTGALANVAALLPGLTPAEARALIRQTAQAFPNSREKLQRNGAGLLNAYKMGRVADRLVKRGWPANRREIFDSASSLFDFASEADALSPEIRSLAEKRDCVAAARRLLLLRQSFLLAASKATKEDLMAALDADGLEGDAFAYSSFGADSSQWIRNALALGRTREERLALIRAAGNLGLEDIPLEGFHQSLPRLGDRGENGTSARMQVTVAMAVLHAKEAPWKDYPKLPESTVGDLIEMASLMGRPNYVRDLVRSYSPRNLPVAAAARAGQAEIVEQLIGLGADLQGTRTPANRSLLMSALNLPENLAVLELLLARGVQVNQLGLFDETPLLVAIDHQDLGAVELLLAKGADPKTGTFRNKSPLALAQLKNDKRILERLCGPENKLEGCQAVAASRLFAAEATRTKISAQVLP
jgi:hypothetical protein